MNVNVNDKLLITPAEAAGLTGISSNTITQWCREKRPFATKVGRNYKISLKLFSDWIDQQCLAGVDLVQEKEF